MAAAVGRIGSSAGFAGLEQAAAHVPQLFGVGAGTRRGEDCSFLQPPVDSRQHGCLTAAVDVSVCWSSQQSARTPARQSAGGATSSQTIASLSSPRIINRILRSGRRLFKDHPPRRLQDCPRRPFLGPRAPTGFGLPSAQRPPPAADVGHREPHSLVFALSSFASSRLFRPLKTALRFS